MWIDIENVWVVYWKVKCIECGSTDDGLRNINRLALVSLGAIVKQNILLYNAKNIKFV